MSSHRLMACAVLGLLGVAVAAGPAGAADAKGATWEQAVHSPLGKLITGQIGRLLVLRSELNLTAQQREKIHKVLAEHKGELVKDMKNVFEKRAALHKAILANQPDETAIRKAADELGHAIGDAAVVGSKVAGEVKPILTDEQRQLIKKFCVESHQAVEKFFTQVSKSD